MRNRCIVCGAKLLYPPVYVCKDLPASAQILPTQDELSSEKAVTLNLCQCSGCGLIQFDNDPVPYYRDSTRAGERSEALIKLRQKQYSHLIEEYNLQGKKILEIGAGKGGFLKTLKEMEYDVHEYGIENNADFVHQARETYGVNEMHGFAESEDTKIEGAPFDAFMSFAYPARLINPNGMLRCAYNNLTEDGVGLVMVPSLEHLCKDGGYFDIVADHIAYYSKETFQFLLNNNGFDVLEEGEVGGPYIYAYVKKRKIFDALKEFKGLEAAMNVVTNFVNNNLGGGIAAWCAGHYAFTVLSAANIGDKISYIIDNAEFKQGHFSPATHIPIVGKEHLKDEPVKTILILGPMYVDEIVQEIREIAGPELTIAAMNGAELWVIS